MKRELIYMDAKSSKFWKIDQEGPSHTVTYGRIGSAGQSATKSFPSEEAAKKDAEKLIREKLGKGYVDQAAEPTDGTGLIPAVAFGNINHLDEFYGNVGTFVGQRVVAYDPEKPTRAGVAYRFLSDWENDNLLENLRHFLASPAALEATALVIGSWQGDDSSQQPDHVVEALVAGKERLPHLAALFLGDIIGEECEISWIQQTDLSPLLAAFPQLQLLRVRGGEQLGFSHPVHANLRALALEAGGLDVSVVRSICQADFPNLEYLELWLGTPDYGGNVSVEDLQPLLSGRLFPKLKYLGLRDCERADEVAGVLATSPIVQRLETLDLSLGTLSDDGARALLQLKSPTLKKLNLHYNFISADLIRQLKSMPLTVDASKHSRQDEDEEPFVAVGE